jgi:hypothetical protein
MRAGHVLAERTPPELRPSRVESNEAAFSPDLRQRGSQPPCARV